MISKDNIKVWVFQQKSANVMKNKKMVRAIFVFGK